MSTVHAGGGGMVTVCAAGVLGQWQPVIVTIPRANTADPIQAPIAPNLFSMTTPPAHQLLAVITVGNGLPEQIRAATESRAWRFRARYVPALSSHNAGWHRQPERAVPRGYVNDTGTSARRVTK